MVQSTPILDARELINRHVQWKLTLKYAIAAREQLPDDVLYHIQHPARCPIGNWLDSVFAQKIRQTAEYDAVVREHFEFHRQMMRIAGLIQQGSFEFAEEALGANSVFLESSRRLALSINALDRIERILVAV